MSLFEVVVQAARILFGVTNVHMRSEVEVEAMTKAAFQSSLGVVVSRWRFSSGNHTLQPLATDTVYCEQLLLGWVVLARALYTTMPPRLMDRKERADHHPPPAVEISGEFMIAARITLVSDNFSDKKVTTHLIRVQPPSCQYLF
jgi:hypothetical protein